MLVLLVYCMFNVVAMEFQLFVYLLVASFLCRSERFGAFHNLQYGTSTTISDCTTETRKTPSVVTTSTKHKIKQEESYNTSHITDSTDSTGSSSTGK